MAEGLFATERLKRRPVGERRARISMAEGLFATERLKLYLFNINHPSPFYGRRAFRD